MIAQSMEDSQVLVHCYQEGREQRQTGYHVRHCFSQETLPRQGDRRHHQVHGHHGEEQQEGEQVHHQQVYSEAKTNYNLGLLEIVLRDFFLQKANRIVTFADKEVKKSKKGEET
eukprot:TRINITY_DN7653_c0_g1_i1.p1 TRINITY_DN7653_c0_g1~~TRINITY_DN7653_c0_g1_i1.p1  ORF type:complete len:114 (-),score=25.25 TRINITY_DN7653_c0_g1_i1:294-635(-)